MPIDNKYGRVTLENQRNIGDDEPVVVFRAQDKLLPQLMDAYADLCAAAGSPARHLDLIARSRQRIVEWQGENFTQVPQSKALAD